MSEGNNLEMDIFLIFVMWECSRGFLDDQTRLDKDENI